jgi:nucleoside-diphosphate-sugar epimerase
MKILLTGATGFVGAALRQRLMLDQHSLVLVARQARADDDEVMTVGELGPNTDWKRALNGCDVVIHLAARVHVMVERSINSASEFHYVNMGGTANLARQAAIAGVQRFVFLSTIKVNGESTQPGHPFSADDIPAPKDPYGVSKYEAEEALKIIAEQTGMEVVIIRSPLVYGPGVKANFEAMMRWVACGFPLPLDAVTQNRRSLVALDNLVDMITTCLNHSAAANQTFLVSDDDDLSTADLLRRIGLALGKPARLFHIPTDFLKLGAALINKQGVYQRLCGSLQVDISKTKQLLNWKPPLTIDEGLRRAAQGLPR